jgi:hypothetical protein
MGNIVRNVDLTEYNCEFPCIIKKGGVVHFDVVVL